eukprot:3136673-Pleurochrysis_carterae.AAC.1
MTWLFEVECPGNTYEFVTAYRKASSRLGHGTVLQPPRTWPRVLYVNHTSFGRQVGTMPSVSPRASVTRAYSAAAADLACVCADVMGKAAADATGALSSGAHKLAEARAAAAAQLVRTRARTHARTQVGPHTLARA